jgi:hypothetical protein
LSTLVPVASCGVVASSASSPEDSGAQTDGLDSATGDATGPGTGDGSSCHPGSVQTYTPDMYHPAAAAWQGVCTQDDIDQFYNTCLGPTPDAGACHAISQPDAADAACVRCLVTPYTADRYGPLIDHGTFITENVAGCIELTDPSGLSCAKAEAALVGCELSACEANCPVVDATSRAAYDACASEADSSGCQAYATMAACTMDAGSTDAGSTACSASSFELFFKYAAKLFCGPIPPGDAGGSFYDAFEEATAADARGDSEQ